MMLDLVPHAGTRPTMKADEASGWTGTMPKTVHLDVQTSYELGKREPWPTSDKKNPGANAPGVYRTVWPIGHRSFTTREVFLSARVLPA